MIYIPPLFGIFLAILIIAFAIWYKSWIFILIGSPLIVLGPIFMYIAKLSNDTRFCIDGSSVYVKGLGEKSIDPQNIKGIKIMQMCSDGPNEDRIIFHRYKDGTPMYLMILLREITLEMYNYKQNEYMFGSSFGEYIIEEVQFDPEAVKYLKTLNPDIKVFY